MATTSEPVRPPDYVDFDEYIDIQLRRTGSTIKSTDVLTAVVGVLTVATLYLLLFVVVDHWVIPGGFSPWARAFMLAAVVLFTAGCLAVKVIWPWRRRVTGLYAASTIEKASPGIQSNLLNLVDIARSHREIRPEIYESIERRAALALAHVDVNEAVDRKTLLRLSIALLTVVVTFCLYWVFSPKNPATSLWRALLPTARTAVATRTEIDLVRPGDVDIIARSQLEVTADLRGEIPAQTSLYFSTADRKFVDERIEMRMVDEGAKQFRCVINGENGAGILQNLTYHVEAGDAHTRDYQVRVIQPPSATIDTIRLEAPSYTRREPVTQTTGPIDALEGSRVTLHATANMPLRSASVQFFDDESASKRAEEAPVQVVDGTKLKAEWPLQIRSDGTYPHFYRIYCTSVDGESERSPSLYSLTIRPDLPPEIVLRDPTSDLELPANAVLPLLIEAHDPDFSLRYINLKVEKNGSPLIGPEVFEAKAHERQFKGTYKWSLRDFHFHPKDSITFWLQAQDNRQPIANTANTPKLRIRIIDAVPEQQVKKDLLMAEKRQEEQQNSEAERRPDEKRDDQNDATDSKEGQKDNKQGQAKDPRQKSAQQKGDKDSGESKQGDKGEGQGQGQGHGESQGDSAGNQKPQHAKNDKAGEEKSEQRSLDPNDSSDDAKVFEKLDKLGHEKEQQEKKPSREKQPPKQDEGNQSGDKNGASSKENQKNGSDRSNPNTAKPNQAEKKSDAAKNEKDKSEKDKSDAGSSEQQAKDKKQQETRQKGDGKPESQPNAGKDQSKSPADKKEGQTDSAGQQKPNQTDKPNETDKPDASKKPDGSKPDQPNADRSSNPQKKDAEKDAEKDAGKDADKGAGKGDREKQKNESDKNAPEKNPGAKNPDDKNSPSESSAAKNSPDKNSDSAKNPENNAAEKNAAEKNAAEQSGGQKNGSEKNGIEKNSPEKKPADKNNPGEKKATEKTAAEKKAAEKNAEQRRQEQEKEGQGDRKPGQPENAKPEDSKPDANAPPKQTPMKKDASQGTEQKDKQPNERQPKKPSDTKSDAKKSDTKKSDAEKSNSEKKEAEGQKGAEKSPQPDEKNPPQAEKSARPGEESPPETKRRKPIDKRDRSDEPKSRRRPEDLETPPSVDAPRKSPPTAGDEKSESGQPADAVKKAEKNEASSSAAQKQAEQKEGGQKGEPTEAKASDKADAQQKSSSGKPSSQTGQPKPGEPKSGEPGKNSQDGKSGKGDSHDPGKPNSSPTGRVPGQQQGGNNTAQGEGTHNSGSGPGQGEALRDTSKDANLDYAKKATDLILNDLDKQLKRGKVDKKVLDELGWTDEQVRKFVERMRHSAQSAKDGGGPADEALRRQYEETLRSLNLRSPAHSRSSKTLPKVQTTEIQGKRSTAPAEYRAWSDAFTRSLSEQKISGERK